MKKPKRPSTTARHTKWIDMYDRLTAEKSAKGRSIMDPLVAIEKVAEHFGISEAHITRVIKGAEK